jgi:hypothetical protein
LGAGFWPKSRVLKNLEAKILKNKDVIQGVAQRHFRRAGMVFDAQLQNSDWREITRKRGVGGND